MYRGTTPYIEIKTDKDLSLMDYVLFTIEDSAGTEINVDNKSGMMTITSTNVTVRLTQDQTLSLIEGDVQMQLRASNSDGSGAAASNIMYGILNEILKDGVIPT